MCTVFLLSLAGAVFFDAFYLVLIPFIALLFYKGWQHPHLIFFLLLVSLPFSIEYNFSPSLGTDIPDEALMVLVSVLFIAYWLYQPGAVSRQAVYHPLLLLFLIHLFWIGVAAAFSSYHLLSLKFLLAKTWYAGAFILAPLVIFREKKWIRIAAILVAGSMSVLVLIALCRHAIDGFSFATVNDSVFPFFRNHVNYSAVLVCMIPLFLSFYHLSKRKSLRILIIVITVLLLAALFFSYARGAWLALGTGAMAWILTRKKVLFASYIIFLLLAAVIFFWLKSGDRYLQYAHDYKTTIFHKDFKEHLVATYRLKDVSTAERFYRWIAGARMIKENELTGFGPGTFYENYKPYAVPAFKTWVSDNKERSTIHNYFLLVLIEQGIPGLVFFLLLLGAMLYYAQHLYHRVTDPFYKMAAMTAAIITVMIGTVNFLSDLIETDKVGGLFFIGLSLLIMTDINTRNSSQSAAHIQSIS